MKFLGEHLLVQFVLLRLAVLVVLVAVLGLGLAWIAGRALSGHAVRMAVQEVERDIAPRATRVLTPADFRTPFEGERYASFDDYVQASILSSLTARIKLWSPDGVVLYSDDRALVGGQYPVKEHLAGALSGKTVSDVSVPEAAENERERALGTLIEVYVPVSYPGAGVVGAFEVYEYYAPLKAVVDSLRRTVFVAIAGGLVVLYLALAYLFWQGWDMVRRQHRATQARLQELSALNGLFRSYLDRDHEIMAQMQNLRRLADTWLRASHSPERDYALERLAASVLELAHRAEAATFPPEKQ